MRCVVMAKDKGWMTVWLITTTQYYLLQEVPPWMGVQPAKWCWYRNRFSWKGGWQQYSFHRWWWQWWWVEWRGEVRGNDKAMSWWNAIMAAKSCFPDSGVVENVLWITMMWQKQWNICCCWKKNWNLNNPKGIKQQCTIKIFVQHCVRSLVMCPSRQQNSQQSQRYCGYIWCNDYKQLKLWIS